jgi:hypothetical protein
LAISLKITPSGERWTLAERPLSVGIAFEMFFFTYGESNLGKRKKTPQHFSLTETRRRCTLTTEVTDKSLQTPDSLRGGNV